MTDPLESVIASAGVHAALGGNGSGLAVEQNAHELAAFLTAMTALGASSMLEIGTGYRAGLARFLTTRMGWEVTSVDIETPITPAGLATLHIVQPGHYIVFGRKFDVVFIDADHHYEAVKGDYEAYHRQASKAVAFHDICGLRDCAGAREFWYELAYDQGVLKPNFHEAIAHGETRAGIGWYTK